MVELKAFPKIARLNRPTPTTGHCSNTFWREKTGKRKDVDVADKTIDGIGDATRTVAEKLTTTAPGVWHGLVEYHRAIAVTELIVTSFLFLALIIGSFAAGYFLKKAIDREGKAIEKGELIPLGALLIIFPLTLSALSAQLPGQVARALAPEYSAANNILNRIGSSK